MSYHGCQLNNWQVCGTWQIAGGGGPAGGIFFFVFYSSSFNRSFLFGFKGVGLGVGGNASGAMMPMEVGNFSPWSAIQCVRPFSVRDLHRASGRLTSAGFGSGISVGATYITASQAPNRELFVSQNVGGLSYGFGIGAMALGGDWTFIRDTNLNPCHTGTVQCV